MAMAAEVVNGEVFLIVGEIPVSEPGTCGQYSSPCQNFNERRLKRYSLSPRSLCFWDSKCQIGASLPIHGWAEKNECEEVSHASGFTALLP